jgi:hypothetical protein
MIQINNYIIEDWVCFRPMPNEQWRRIIRKETFKVYEYDSLRVAICYSDGDDITTTTTWNIYFHDDNGRPFWNAYSTMYGENDREFNSK